MPLFSLSAVVDGAGASVPFDAATVVGSQVSQHPPPLSHNLPLCCSLLVFCSLETDKIQTRVQHLQFLVRDASKPRRSDPSLLEHHQHLWTCVSTSSLAAALLPSPSLESSSRVKRAAADQVELCWESGWPVWEDDVRGWRGVVW